MSFRPCLRAAAAAVFSLILSSSAGAQSALWFETVGTPVGDYAAGAAGDGAGGLVATGRTAGSLFAQTAGGEDVWIARRDGAGVLQWTRQFGTDGVDRGWGLALADGGDLFAAGETEGSLGMPWAGALDAWIARLDPLGQTIWLQQFGTPGIDRAQGLMADGSGGTFACGLTTGALFGPSQGGQDAWIARLDSGGGALWAKQVGGTGSENLLALASDGAGGAFVCGATTDAVFGAHLGGWDALLARIDAAGNVLWSRQFGTPQDDFALCLATRASGGVYVGLITEGAYAGPMDSDGDAAVARYGVNGALVWKRQFGSPDQDALFCAARDGGDGVVVGGTTNGALGPPFVGDGSAWLARLDEFGNLTEGALFGEAAFDVATAAVEDGTGGVLATGLAYPAGSANPDAWMTRISFDCEPAASYCTASATSIPGCTAELKGSGAPSLGFARNFRIESDTLPGGNLGLLVFGDQGPAALPLGTQGGLLCVQPPFFRSKLNSAGGSAGACDGQFAFTLQDLIDQAPIVLPGATLHVQLWARDQGSADGFLLSDGLTFDVCP